MARYLHAYLAVTFSFQLIFLNIRGERVAYVDHDAFFKYPDPLPPQYDAKVPPAQRAEYDPEVPAAQRAEADLFRIGEAQQDDSGSSRQALFTGDQPYVKTRPREYSYPAAPPPTYITTPQGNQALPLHRHASAVSPQQVPHLIEGAFVDRAYTIPEAVYPLLVPEVSPRLAIPPRPKIKGVYQFLTGSLLTAAFLISMSIGNGKYGSASVSDAISRDFDLLKSGQDVARTSVGMLGLLLGPLIMAANFQRAAFSSGKTIRWRYKYDENFAEDVFFVVFTLFRAWIDVMLVQSRNNRN